MSVVKLGTLALAAAMLTSGCGPETPESPTEQPARCRPGELEVVSGCEPAGLPSDMACPPGEMPAMDGCLPAGVPPDRCFAGTTPLAGGCEPILPEQPCAPGTVALPGETLCRPLAPCAAGRWGDIPVDDSTVYVDGSAIGAGDGSEQSPYKTIQAAVEAAPSGATVAIAAGTYPERVFVSGKTLHLWGVCPDLVAVIGTAEGLGAIEFVGAGKGSGAHMLSLQGPRVGIGMTDSLEVMIDRVRVHDTGDVGILVENAYGPTSATIRDSLVEQAAIYGIVVVGSIADIERTAVRSMKPASTGYGGHGIETHPGKAIPGQLTLRDVLVEGGRESGVTVAASTARLERVVVRGTTGHVQGTRGFGLAFFDIPNYPGADVRVVDAIVQDSRDAGLLASASRVEVDGITIRDVAPRSNGGGGFGIFVQGWQYAAARGHLELRHGLVERTHGHGVLVLASEASFEGLLVRDVTGDQAGMFGRGIGIQAEASRSRVDLRYSLVESAQDAGVFVHGSDLAVEASLIREIALNGTGAYGTSITAVSASDSGERSNVLVRASLLEKSSLAGIFLASSVARLERSVVRETWPNGHGHFGDGALVIADVAEAHLDVVGSRIESSSRAAVACFGASASLENAALACQAFDFDAEPFGGRACAFEDRGGNACGCGELEGSCKAVSAALLPPPAAPPFEDH